MGLCECVCVEICVITETDSSLSTETDAAQRPDAGRSAGRSAGRLCRFTAADVAQTAELQRHRTITLLIDTFVTRLSLWIIWPIKRLVSLRHHHQEQRQEMSHLDSLSADSLIQDKLFQATYAGDERHQLF